jgi:hypothetical protein
MSWALRRDPKTALSSWAWYLYRKEFEDALERILGLCGTLSYG